MPPAPSRLRSFLCAGAPLNPSAGACVCSCTTCQVNKHTEYPGSPPQWLAGGRTSGDSLRGRRMGRAGQLPHPSSLALTGSLSAPGLVNPLSTPGPRILSFPACWPPSSPQPGHGPLTWPTTLPRQGGCCLCLLGLLPARRSCPGFWVQTCTIRRLGEVSPEAPCPAP